MPGLPTPAPGWADSISLLDLPFELLGLLLGQAYSLPLKMLDLLQKSVLCLTAFLAIGGLDGGRQRGMYGAAAQSSYLLGLGEPSTCNLC